MTLRHFWFSQSTPAIDKIINMKNARAFREYRFVIYWLMDLSVVGYYGGFTYKHPIIIL